ncbi:MAG: sigma-70 family RNA polymerase sigma factor [Gemmatimonadales bacterium]|nr:sigma-70 family RNA polymerase sigma factor [Gemmatimonadales bacterium]
MSPESVADAGLAAFEAEMLRHLGDLMRYARWLARDDAEGDDLVQETYLKAFRAWTTFRPGSDGRRWLFTICRHTFYRERQRARRDVALDGDAETDALAFAQAHGRAARSGLGGALDAPDLAPAIATAMAALPPAFREVVALVDAGGADYAEAAAALGVPIGTVRSRLFRARRLLQAHLLDHARDAGFGRHRSPGEGA